ncbi:hypothetical protein AB0B50_40430 [Streptomyces sp. NPDC041068]|uniref:hypothetical protein n=1 Tax=Streptomyces sp. NPDC041068 TaxID=3155130 RepID=UPI0034002A3F
MTVPVSVPRGGDGAAVAVDGGSLVAFSAGVSKGHRKDVLHSVLLAQLVANKKYNRYRESGDWYRTYGETLERVGWVVGDHEGFVRCQAHTFPYRIGPVILEKLGRVCDRPAMELAGAAIVALVALGEAERAAELFEKESHFERLGNFQVAVVDETGGGVICRLGRFRLLVRDEATDVVRLLRSDFHAGDEVLGSSQLLRLHDEVYGPLRDGVAEKLGSRADALIVPVGLRIR